MNEFELKEKVIGATIALAGAMSNELVAKSAFKECPCFETELNLRFAEADLIEANASLHDALDELKRFEGAKKTAPHFIVCIETPRKTLSYKFTNEHDAMLAYEKACLDMKLSRKSTRVSLSRGDTVFKSADLM